MASSVSEVGRRPYGGSGAENTAAVTPISINASTAIVLPAKPQGGTIVPTGVAGVTGGQLVGNLECEVTIEGTVTSRYTTNGVTPTAAIGSLLPAPTAASPVKLILRGQAVIAAFRIIGTAAGNTITYLFWAAEER